MTPQPPDPRPWFTALDPSQEKAVAAFHRADVLILTGGAGSGKTHCAVALALTHVALKRAERVVLTRPTVPCGDDLGYMPGDVDEKMLPWLGPVCDVLASMTWHKFDELPFDVIPLQHIRGRTIANAVAILDEAQNATDDQLNAYLSRLGRNGKLILCGDTAQSDLGASPLASAVGQLRGLDGVACVHLHGQHRNPLVTAMMKARKVR